MAQSLGEIIADFQTQLTAAVAVSDETATLQSATDDDSVALPAGTYFFTVDGDSSSKEYIKATLSGTSLTAIKSVSRQNAETTGFARKHRAGATVEITDFAHIKRINDLLDGTTDFDSGTPLKYDGNPTISDDGHFATKKYVDDVAIAGGADASTTVKGLSKLSTAPASASNPIAVGDNDSRMLTTDEKAAAAGTGTPSASNKFVTEDTIETEIEKYELLFGDGHDGDATISSNTTLTEDKFYDNLTIDSGFTLNPSGYRVFVKGTLTVNGTIESNGGNGGDGGNGGGTGSAGTAGTAGAAAHAVGSLATGLAGVVGGVGGAGSDSNADASGANGTDGNDSTNTITSIAGASGGAGGDGPGAGSPGSGGSAGTKTDAKRDIVCPTDQDNMFDATGLFTYAAGSGGGGGGAGSSSTSGNNGSGGGGGGAGAPGGVVWISAHTVSVASGGTISANGGDGGDGGDGGTGTGSKGGGGGGGGAGASGGLVFIRTTSYTNSGTVEAAAGAAGAAGTAGTGGSSGTAGTVGNAGVVKQVTV